MGQGVTVALNGESSVLSSNVLGPATLVTRIGERWDVSVDFEQLDAELARMFPDVGQEGGEATFDIAEAEEAGEPGTVIITPGAPRTVCCDEASVRRIERALTSDLEVATLLYRDIESERGTEWAQSLGIEERVATFTTNYTCLLYTSDAADE